MSNTNAQPGWYPVDERTDRFWDGNVWTGQTRIRGAATTGQPSPAPGTRGAFPETVASGAGSAATRRADGAQQPDASSQPPGSTPWYRRNWVIAVAALLIGLVIGSASAGTADPKDSAAYKAVSDDLSSTKSTLDDTEADLLKAQADLKKIAGELPEREAALKQDQAELKKDQAKLAEAQASVTKAQAAVSKREKAVGIAEKEIKNNTIPGDGTFEVGKDMKAGTYKTPGPNSDQCYYAVNGDANGNDIKSNNITSGPAVVSVNDGEFFETNDCQDWVLQR